MAELATVLDMLKVMAFALQDGKVAVHCHAGLGRTGRAAAAAVVQLTSTCPQGFLLSLQVCC